MPKIYIGINWQWVEKALNQKRGIPHQIHSWREPQSE